jgi:transposase
MRRAKASGSLRVLPTPAGNLCGQSISGFVGFLRQDLDAVTAGLTLHWSSGIVEGHVNKVKTLKRAMYGRASFGLLRTRTLTQP